MGLTIELTNIRLLCFENRIQFDCNRIWIKEECYLTLYEVNKAFRCIWNYRSITSLYGDRHSRSNVSIDKLTNATNLNTELTPASAVKYILSFLLQVEVLDFCAMRGGACLDTEMCEDVELTSNIVDICRPISRKCCLPSGKGEGAMRDAGETGETSNISVDDWCHYVHCLICF